MKIREIIDYFETFAPLELAKKHDDNSGLLVGNENDEVTSIMFALDITKEVVLEAKEKGANLIISHHPVIFYPIYKMDSDSVLHLLAKHEIAALCMHINLDLATDCGVNICLAKALELKNIQMYEDKYCAVGNYDKPISQEDFAKLVKEKLNCNGIRYIEGKEPIKKVAVVGGAGGDLFWIAQKIGAQAFVTGELKHHEILAILNNGITAVEGGHFKTEDVVFLPLIEKLQAKFPSLIMQKSKVFSDNLKYLA